MEAFIKIGLMIFLSWLTAELIKLTVHSIKYKKLNLKSATSYGGFPSAHTTLVSSLVFSILFIEGFSTNLIISIVLFSIVIRDVIKIRANIDLNSKNISILSKNKLKTARISHSYLEIISGVIIGFIIPLIINLLFNAINI
jgi:acid phosphatase family membrane protein YuiD